MRFLLIILIFSIFLLKLQAAVKYKLVENYKVSEPIKKHKNYTKVFKIQSMGVRDFQLTNLSTEFEIIDIHIETNKSLSMYDEHDFQVISKGDSKYISNDPKKYVYALHITVRALSEADINYQLMTHSKK